MKKFLSLLLVVLMVMSAAAFAESAEAPAPKLGQVVCYVHGNGFAVVTAVVQGDAIILAKIDEFQFLGNREDLEAVGVPVKDGTFSQTNADTGAVTVLGSKRVNSDLYSLNMQRAGSKVQIAANYDAIEAFAVGKTIAELEAIAAGEGVVDAVSGATLADTANYLNAIVAAAKAAGNRTGTYTVWNTTGEDVVEIYVIDKETGEKSINYASAPLHTLGSENDNNPYIFTRTVPAEADGHMKFVAVTESGQEIVFPHDDRAGLAIEVTNIEIKNQADVVSGATQIGWFAPAAE